MELLDIIVAYTVLNIGGLGLAYYIALGRK